MRSLFGSIRSAVSRISLAPRKRRPLLFHCVILGLCVTGFCGCAAKPLIPHSAETPPLILAPASAAGVVDARSRFREIYCAITEERGKGMPDYRPCEEALARLENEAPPTGASVDLGVSQSLLRILIVLGVGTKCFDNIIDLRMTAIDHLARFGHEASVLEVEPLSSGSRNARIIRDAVMATPEEGRRLVLLGYSKGAPDILEAVAAYPELQQRVSAVVSLAGAVGGSPLVNPYDPSVLKLLQKMTGSQCKPGDEGALESLNSGVRKRWYANHALPRTIRYYSVVAYPDPDRISSLLKSSYDQLSQVDSRNDSQLIFYDQLIPGSVLLGYLNADHWAVVIPINRNHPLLALHYVDKNAFPREVLWEAIVRFIEEDLSRR